MLNPKPRISIFGSSSSFQNEDKEGITSKVSAEIMKRPNYGNQSHETNAQIANLSDSNSDMYSSGPTNS